MIIRQQYILSYAKALLSVGGGTEVIQKRESQLTLIADLLSNHPNLLALLNNPELDIEKKIGVLEKASNLTFDRAVKNLLKLMIKRHHSEAIKRTAIQYYKLVVNSLKEIVVEVSSTSKLSKIEKQKIIEQLENKFQKKCNLVEKIDPSLLGGFIIIFQDKLIDLSVKGKLNQLKTTLLKVKL